MSQDAKMGQDTSTDPTLDEHDIFDDGNTPEVELSDDAASSPATDVASEDDDLLSIARDVVDEQTKTDPEEPASSAESEEATEEASEDAATAEDDEDYTDVPFHKHPRFQQLLRKSKAFEQDATRYHNVQNFMDQHGLGAEEAADLLVIGGLMKTNPAEAWNRMKPTIQKLLVAAGEVLPNDLQQRVQKGEISREGAIEISRLRAQQQSLAATQSFEQQRQAQQREQEAISALTNTASAWEQDRRRKDPNFDTKYEALMDAVYVLQRREGKPNTPEGVKAQLDKAYKSLAAPAKPQPTQRPAQRQNSSGQVAGNAKPAQQSTLDIINQIAG